MIKNTRASKYRIIAALANLLVLCLCTLLWREAISVQPVYEEQIVTNEGSFVPTMDTIQHYSWSIDVPTEETAYTIVVTNAAEEQILEEQVQFDDALEVGAFMSMSTLAEPVALDAADSYTVHFYQEDGAEFSGRVSMALYGEPASLRWWFLAVCIWVLLITNAILIMGIRYPALSQRTVTLFGAVILLLMGILSNIALRPLNAPDEEIHFAVTYELSGTFYSEVEDDQQECERMAAGIWQDMSHLPMGQQIYSFWYDHAYGSDEVAQQSDRFDGSVTYPKYGYLPAAIGTALARIFHAPYQVLLIAGRMCNYIMFLVLVLLCGRLAPDLRVAAMGVAALPSTIWLAASFSYDGWNLGFSMLFICYLWRLTAHQHRVGIRELIGFAVLLVAFAPIKYIYVILALLICAIPRSHWVNLKGIIVGGIIAICGLVFTMRSRLYEVTLSLMTSQSDVRGLEQGLYGTSYTLSYAIRHPIQVLLTFIHTAYEDLELMCERLLIGEFYNNDVPAYFVLLLGGLFVLLMLLATKETLTGRASTESEKWTAFVYRGTFLLGVLAVYGSFLFLYSYYNDGQIGTIGGVQGRYFLPLVLLLAQGGSARLAGRVMDWMRKRNIAWEQLWAVFLYVGVVVMLCRIPGFME